MRKKYLNTLIALVILAALWGAFTYYDKRHSREASKIETSKEEKLFTLDSKHITSITFHPRDGEAVTCQHDGRHLGDRRTQEAFRRPGHALHGSEQLDHGHGGRGG